jgi:hypothetical protein
MAENAVGPPHVGVYDSQHGRALPGHLLSGRKAVAYQGSLSIL